VRLPAHGFIAVGDSRGMAIGFGHEVKLETPWPWQGVSSWERKQTQQIAGRRLIAKCPVMF